MIIIIKKGLSNTPKRIVDLIFVRKQTFCFRDITVCYTSNKRCFSDSTNKIPNQMKSIKVVCYNKINNFKDFITKWNTEMLKFLNRLLNKIRICLIASYRWMIHRITNLFLSMRRILQYRVPLCYVLIVNILSIVGCFYICMLIYFDIYMDKIEAVDTIINTLILNQELNVNNKQHLDDHIFIDEVEYVTNETEFIHPMVIYWIMVFVIKLCTNR